MKKRNVYLIDLGTGSNYNLLPLSIGLVGSYSMADPALSRIYDFKFLFLRGDVSTKVDSMEDASVVAIACYIWNLQGSLRMAKQAKDKFPNATVVLGGYSVPKAPDRVQEFLHEHPFVDVLVHGEGEVIFSDVLRELSDGNDLSKVDGISFRSGDCVTGFFTTLPAQRVKDVNILPSPFLNGLFDDLIDQYGSGITGALWETNRGCPYYCTFCDWGSASVNKIKRYDMERLKAELDWISKKDFFYMFIADANFGIFVDRDYEIAGWIAENAERFGSPLHVATNWAKNKHERVVAIADRFAQGGVACDITLAVQSYNDATLEAIKRQNISREEMLQLKKDFHDRKLPTYMEVILGLPLETYDSFVAGLNKMLTPRLSDRFVIYLCQLLENTEMASAESRERYELKTTKCWHAISNRQVESSEDSEVEEFVIGSSTMAVDDWERAYVTGYLLTVLYNHRAAFFPIRYFHREHGIVVTDIIEFVLSECRRRPSAYPQIKRGVDHLERQRKSIVAGETFMSKIEGAGDIIMTAADGALCLMVNGADTFYAELHDMFLSFARERNFSVNETVFNEVINYQRARMPAWPISDPQELRFSTNIPVYFDVMTDGLDPPEIVERDLTLNVEVPEQISETFEDFAKALVRRAITVKLLPVKITEGRGEHQEVEHLNSMPS